MNTPSNQIIDNLDVTSFFNEAQMDFDLREGVIWNPAKTRVCVLSGDMLTGVYNGLYEEAGSGWKEIFISCGNIWGGRLAARLDKECSLLLGKRIGDLPLEDFILFFTEYFVFHGWGKLTINLDRVRETGLIEAEVTNSIFSSIVTDEDEMADPMLAGIIASFIGYLSGRELACVQTECLTKGGELSRFIITIPDRLENADDLVKSGKKHQELLEIL